jgi:hypothetical protein
VNHLVARSNLSQPKENLLIKCCIHIDLFVESVFVLELVSCLEFWSLDTTTASGYSNTNLCCYRLKKLLLALLVTHIFLCSNCHVTIDWFIVTIYLSTGTFV